MHYHCHTGVFTPRLSGDKRGSCWVGQSQPVRIAARRCTTPLENEFSVLNHHSKRTTVRYRRIERTAVAAQAGSGVKAGVLSIG